MKRVGVIGGGQLAWMMAGAARQLGVELVIQTPQTTDPAAAIATQLILADIDNATATAQLAAQCEVITFENEFVDLDALTPLEQQGVCFRPSLSALRPLLDKYDQRLCFQDLGLPTPQFYALADDSYHSGAPSNHLLHLPFPRVLKTRRHGYDGQGTFIIKTMEEWAATLTRLAAVPLLVEEFVPFERELAVMAARSVTGEIVVYPVVETQQEQQVCRRVIVPAEVDTAIALQIDAIARTLLSHLHIVGIIGIELFLTATGKVLVNEIAPRTHNSGHYTLDACATSQFEQQLRAVSGLPLGSPALRSPGAVMINLLGFEQSANDYSEARAQLAACPNTQVHWYGKTESRPGRKLGHVTVLLEQEDRATAIAIAQQLESIWYSP